MIKIGTERIMNDAFEDRNDVIKWDVLKIPNDAQIKITIISKNSDRRQGIRISTDLEIEINGELAKAFQIWEDTAPKEVLCKCYTTDGNLSVYNIWDKGRGAESQAYSSGMLKETVGAKATYYCNDIGFQTNFDKLVFSVEVIE